MDAPPEITYYSSRLQSLLAALIFGLFAMLGPVFWCGGAGGIACVFSLIRAVRRVPVLRATPEGIALGFNWRHPHGEFRRWEELADLVPHPNGLGIVLTEEYVSRQSGVRVELLRFNRRREGVHELVPLTFLPLTPGETVELLRRTYFVVRPSPARTEATPDQGRNERTEERGGAPCPH
jgi:hypothetical protein